ncbi:GNAT family N-acetyltransferase [Nonomuraea sp. JJY05]|uniref:GNAT family N-acetyltransferase n=1 Tax=Nonomuraea sp. JJY05 TaxID=3350255 RepID=UPI00373E5291
MAAAGSTAQLFRAYVRPAHRRQGLARKLVKRACAHVASTPGYTRLYLHTDGRVEGAELFWRSVAVPIHDDRDGDPSRFRTVHFEVPL